MKLVVYSTKIFEQHGIGWHRAGNDIAYYANGIRKTVNPNKCFYTLKFSYSFTHDNDQVYFAYSYPYTYSQLTEYLNKLEAENTNNE